MENKREKSKSRQEKLSDGQTYTGFEFKGVKHRPLTGGALKFLQRINSALYTSDYENTSPVDIVVEFLYATSASARELCEAADNWNVLQYEFADGYTIQELSDPIIIDNLSRDLGNQRAASFEVVAEGDSKK